MNDIKIFTFQCHNSECDNSPYSCSTDRVLPSLSDHIIIWPTIHRAHYGIFLGVAVGVFFLRPRLRLVRPARTVEHQRSIFAGGRGYWGTEWNVRLLSRVIILNFCWLIIVIVKHLLNQVRIGRRLSWWLRLKFILWYNYLRILYNLRIIFYTFDIVCIVPIALLLRPVNSKAIAVYWFSFGVYESALNLPLKRILLGLRFIH